MASFFTAALPLVLFLFNLVASDAATESALISSIDCGASEPYTDNLGIQWVPDSSLITAGQPQTVPNATSVPRPMQTLRAFPIGTNLCYNLSIASGGGGPQVLLRASFFYGNYDGKNSPPAFDLEFDGNSWATVETAADRVVTKEVIYQVRGGATSVCLVRTNDGETPFVSAIEVRGFGNGMYSLYDQSSSALVLASRAAFGLAAAVRYPDDQYDRIWSPAHLDLDVVQNQAAAAAINTDIGDAPPAAIFQSAVTPSAGFNFNSINATTPSGSITAYVNLYFTEIKQLTAGQNRSFQVFLDGNAETDISPPFGSIIEISMANFYASNRTQITLEPTANATLSPVISAIEIYVIIPIAGGGNAAAPPAPRGAHSICRRRKAICRRLIRIFRPLIR